MTRISKLPKELRIEWYLFIEKYDDLKWCELRDVDLKPKGFYKWDGKIQWNTPSGNPPDTWREYEFDFGT